MKAEKKKEDQEFWDNIIELIKELPSGKAYNIGKLIENFEKREEEKGEKNEDI